MMYCINNSGFGHNKYWDMVGKGLIVTGLTVTGLTNYDLATITNHVVHTMTRPLYMFNLI